VTAPKLRRILRRRTRAVSDDGSMSLRDHLVELRQRLIKALLFVALGAVVGWLLYPYILDILKEPYCSIPADRRFPPDVNGECKLTFFGPLDGFLLRFKVAAIAGALLSAPFWLYQLWAFVTPGLRRSERRWTVVFVAASTVLFAAGAALSYLTLSKALSLLITTAGEGTVAAIEANGPIRSLAGPIARADVGTVERHIQALRDRAPALLPTYLDIARRSLAIAEAKGGAAKVKLDALRALLDRTE